MWSTSAGGHLMKVVNLTGVCIWFIELPSTQQTVGYNLVYNDMFQLTRVIIRLCSEPLNVLNDCAFWDPKKLTLFTLLTYNYYLKVLWLCVFNAVPIFEYCSVFLLLLNVLLFLASSFLLWRLLVGV